MHVLRIQRLNSLLGKSFSILNEIHADSPKILQFQKLSDEKKQHYRTDEDIPVPSRFYIEGYKSKRATDFSGFRLSKKSLALCSVASSCGNQHNQNRPSKQTKKQPTTQKTNPKKK